jgi:hypothetical protein
MGCLEAQEAVEEVGVQVVAVVLAVLEQLTRLWIKVLEI